MQFLQNEKLRYVQYDCTDMDPQEKKTKVQQPLFEVFRQIYKGPNYDTPYFCYKKLEKTAPNVVTLACELCYNEDNQVVGGATVKIFTVNFQGENHGVLEGTTGYLEKYRGDNRGQIFFNSQQMKYTKKFPDHKFCFFDLNTSSNSYKTFNYLDHTYPRVGITTPPYIQNLIDYLMKQSSGYKQIESSHVQKGCYILQGALVRENARTLYTRLTRGKGDKRLEFFFQQTGAINGIGLMCFVDSYRLGMDKNHYINARKKRIENPVPPHRLPKLPYSDLQYLVQLRDSIHMYTGYTKNFMLPKNVSISLLDSDIEFVRTELNKLGFSNPLIQYMTKIPGLSYKDYSKILSQKQMTIVFKHSGHPVFEGVIPKGEFNPFIGPIGAKFVELVLHADINVQDKYVVDLGCGCGNIGMAAILMGATKVLFSDIAPEYLDHIKNYELMVKEEHEFMSQNLLAETVKDKSNHDRFDVVIMNTPTFSFSFNAPEGTTSSKDGQQSLLFCKPDFYLKLLQQSYQILKNNGELILWSMFVNLTPETVIQFFYCFKDNFDILNFKVVCIDRQSNIPIFDAQESSPDNFYMFYSLKKVVKKPYNDFQFEVTVTLGLQYLGNYLLARGFEDKSKLFFTAVQNRKKMVQSQPKL